MVRKRDAHLGNWLIDEAGRITAIDLDSPKCLPAGHDLAQLIEDGALIPVSNSGFAERYNLFRDYLSFAGIDDSEFPLEAHARELRALDADGALTWRFEPGRWLVAPIAALVSEVLWVKQRPDALGTRFVVLAAGMNDLIRPALYGARHRIVALRPRPGAVTSACVVGPVCESGDTFDGAALLPPLETGDLVAILDAGAYGSVMSSNYNGRGRLAELVVEGGRLHLARAAEAPSDLIARQCDEPLGEV